MCGSQSKWALSLAAAVFTLGLNGCGDGGGDGGDNTFSGSGSSEAPPGPVRGVPPTPPLPTLVAGSPRLPAGSRPRGVTDLGAGVYQLDGTEIAADAAFVAPIAAIDAATRTLVIAGQTLSFDDQTQFSNRTSATLRAGNIVSVVGMPTSADTWRATRITHVADAATPSALPLTLSGLARETTDTTARIGNWKVDFTTARNVSTDVATAITVVGYDDGSGMFRAIQSTPFGLANTQPGQHVVVTGPAFIDGTTLYVAGIAVQWVPGVDVSALELAHLMPGDVVDVAGVVDATRGVVYGTDARR